DANGYPEQLALTFHTRFLQNNAGPPVRFRRIDAWCEWVAAEVRILPMMLTGPNAVDKIKLNDDPDIGNGMGLKVRFPHNGTTAYSLISTGQAGEDRKFNSNDTKKWRNGGIFQ